MLFDQVLSTTSPTQCVPTLPTSEVPLSQWHRMYSSYFHSYTSYCHCLQFYCILVLVDSWDSGQMKLAISQLSVISAVKWLKWARLTVLMSLWTLYYIRKGIPVGGLCVTYTLLETCMEWWFHYCTNWCELMTAVSTPGSSVTACHTMLHGLTATPKLKTMSHKLYENCVHAMWTRCFECGNTYSATWMRNMSSPALVNKAVDSHLKSKLSYFFYPPHSQFRKHSLNYIQQPMPLQLWPGNYCTQHYLCITSL